VNELKSKKTLCKMLLCLLGCAGIIVVTKRMPELMKALYNAVFGEFDHVTLFFVLGIFAFEIFILKRWGRDKKSRYLCLGMTVIAALLVLFKGSTSFVDKLSPGADTALITRVITDSNIDEINTQQIFCEYYFDGRKLIVSDKEREAEEYQYIYKMAVPVNKIITGQETVLSDKAADQILSYPYREYEHCCFVLDESWKATDTINLVIWGDRHIFCSEELLEKVLQASETEDFSYAGENLDVFGIMSDMAENSSCRELKQTFVMLLLLFIGGAISMSLFGEKYPWLSFFLSLPMGAAAWCVCCVVFMILHIPYRLLTMLMVMVLGIGVLLYRERQKLKTIDWRAIVNFLLPAVFVTVFFACMKMCYTGTDSLMKCAYGYRLACFGDLRGILGDAAPYGILEPVIMSIGYLVKCDALYVFYPLMAICSVGIMCSGLYYINGKSDNYLSILALGAGVFFLCTNFDYLLSGIMMAAHGPTAVYTLILIMFIVMKRRISVPGFEWIASLAATIVLLTRIEGAIYVLFFLALSLNIENESLKMRKVNFVTAGVILVWNVYQMIEVGSGADPMFWTPGRGIMLITGAVFLLVLTWLMGRQWRLVSFVKEHYFLIASGMICLCIGVLAVSIAREIASINLPVFLSHFSNNEEMNDRINAGGFWTFLLLLSPIAISTKNKVAKYSVSLIFGYILLIYFVCLFRTGAPLHYGYGDSGRRTLVQIMPAAIWLLAYSVGDREEYVQVKDEG